jgi:uncharacterized zinc-type alcohol dehydrogenase-like protein
MIASKGYAAFDAKTPLAPYSFERRDASPTDVVVEILYSGICHSDIHQTRSEWMPSNYPMVPGHEIVGRVTAIGADVTRFKVGDLAGVGVIIDSCHQCGPCKANLEVFCEKGATETYGRADKYGAITMGGYSNNIVVEEAFVYTLAKGMSDEQLAATAPLLCAGITTYSPLRHWKVGKGSRVGVVGLGGLGHMGLKFAHSFGAHVVQFTTSLNKKDDALRLGADEVVLSTDKEAMAKFANSLDFILDTVSAPHDVNALLALLKIDGTLCSVGIPDKPIEVAAFSLVLGRRSLAGSAIGGIQETQEMLDYCAEHGIVSDIELIPVSGVNDAYTRVVKGDVKYRFVMDMATL